jgi:uncharacterized protein (TIGR03437 family)
MSSRNIVERLFKIALLPYPRGGSMSKLFSHALAALALAFPVVALANVTGNPTLSAGSTLNLDTGAVSTSGSGDITWNGSSLSVVGSATDADLASYGLTGSSAYSGLSQIELSALGGALGASSITPAVNDIIEVLTNKGDYAGIWVTAINGTSIALAFTTYTSSTTTSGGPTINALANNYSYIPAGLPSYGIAPASLFIIYGSGMSAPGAPVTQSSAAPGLPITLNGTSISVTVNGVTTNPAMYYASPTQIAAVLPSSTPVGTGTITVTYNETASAPATIVVTKSAFGMDTLYGTGSGGIVATVGSSVIVPTASASPGQTITIWGSGLGADTANNDRTFPLKEDDLNNAQVYIGGVQATVTYDGRSQYPGVDQIDVVVPELGATPAFQTASLQAHDAPRASGFQGGCEISVVVVANGIASNFGTLPVNPGGGVCSDPELGITGTQIGQTTSQGTYSYGNVSLIQETLPSITADSRAKPKSQSLTTNYIATADFLSESGVTYVSSSAFFSIGSCIVTEVTSSSSSNVTSTGLDAGTPIKLTGGGLSVSLSEVGTSGLGLGLYEAMLTSPLVGGTAYTFTGPGGKDVGPFTVTINLPVPLDWTNESSISTVTESQGQLITWSGGASGTLVFIEGSSSGSGVDASFICVAPVGDEQFTIPSYVLQTLPAGTGGLGVFNFSSPASFTATGINRGTASAGVFNDENVTYQ